MGIKEISDTLGIGKSTVHRVLDTLMSYDYVEHCENRSDYCLSWGAFMLGSAAMAWYDVSQLDRSALDELCHTYFETVNMGALNKSSVVIIHKSVPKITLSVQREVGELEPFHCTALGKILVSELPESRIREMMGKVTLTQFTHKTITDPDRFLEALAKAREFGYAMDEEEYNLGLMCIAAPVRNYSGKIVASVSVSVPSVRFTFNKAMVIKEDLLKVCARLSEQLGKQSGSI